MSVVLDERAEARAGAKSPRAYRTIAEVAEELAVAQHVLRFWESKFSQLKPLKRRGGRRYYSPEDVVLLRRIRGLLYGDGYTIRGVQKLLREGSGSARARDALGDGIAIPPHLPPAKPAAGAPPPSVDAASVALTGGLVGATSTAELRRAIEEILAALEDVRALLRPPPP
jgi:DNA-binding transcriptional MerR regulator